jgi:site-specific recombinase XerD
LKHFKRLEAERGIERPDQITAEHIEAFQDWLIETGKFKMSQRIASSALRELLKWAVGKQLVRPELWLAVAKVKAPRGVPRALPEEDLKKLLLYLLPWRPRMSLLEARDRALFLYFLGSSARVSEVLQITEGDFERAWVVQKGGGQQMLLNPPMVVEAVKQYLELRGPVASEFIWITHDTNRPVRRITPEGVRSIWVRLARQVGAQHFTTRQIRHTAASVLLDKHVQESVIAAHLGHSGLATVMTSLR